MKTRKKLKGASTASKSNNQYKEAKNPKGIAKSRATKLVGGKGRKAYA